MVRERESFAAMKSCRSLGSPGLTRISDLEDRADDALDFAADGIGRKDDFKLFMRYGKDLPDVGTGLPCNWISCIEFDKYGRVWLGFEGDHGIAMYDGKDFTVWDQDVPGIGFGQTFNIAMDNERDRIWVSNRFEYGASTARMLGTNTDVKSIPLPLPSSRQDQGSIYDLSGKRIPQPRRGELYIKGNKKFVVK